VRPDYTDEARRLGIEGDVVLEIIVRADGSVGEIKVLQGLRGGLDRRAIDAVKQWRFSPARRHGSPVDVVVEVAVEFKLR
jgi:protein TonB